MSDEERAALSQVLTHLGASPRQAALMAEQILKRADQIAVERGMDRKSALAYVLNLVTKGSQGESPPGFEGGDSIRASEN